LPENSRFRCGVYWTDFVRDAGYSLRFLRAERHAPRDYVTPYARRQCDAIFDRHDMGPFKARVAYLVGSAGRTARTSLNHK
jgi:hypothetical protein